MIQAGDLKNEHLKGQFGKLALHGERQKNIQHENFQFVQEKFSENCKIIFVNGKIRNFMQSLLNVI